MEVGAFAVGAFAVVRLYYATDLAIMPTPSPEPLVIDTEAVGSLLAVLE